MGAFHAYDIRGIYGVDFDAATAYKVGYFIPELLDTDKVLVGRDCRVSSEEIRNALVEGITDAGADVYDIGLSTTPLVYFGTANYGFKASVQVTASHNPAQYNGLKVSRANALPVGLDTGLGQIKAWIDEGRPTPAAARKGKVEGIDIRKDYLEFLLKFKKDYSSIKVAFDLSNGMSNLFAKEIFTEEGNVFLFDELDGRFPNHEPNPLLPSCQKALGAEVLKVGADIGVIFDGDADRVMFIDEQGRFISPDLIIALLGKYFIDVRGEKGIALQDIRSSKSVGEYLESKGMRMATWKVGRAYAALKLREIDGVWGGELAGHYYFRDFFYSDSGLLASILVLNIVSDLKADGKTIGGFIDSISKYCGSGEVNFRVEDKAGAMEAVKDYWTKDAEPTAFMDFDGYRVEFPDWWFNIRPSNTEPYLRFLCEASTKEMMEQKVNETKKFLEDNFGAILS